MCLYQKIRQQLYMERIGKMLNKYEKLREDRYQRFVYTLNQCGKFLLNSTDEVIETCIFEDFDIGVRGDICDDNLEIFIEEGWIDEEIKEKCLQLRSLFLNIQAGQSQIWNIQSVRISKVWLEILELSDEIRSLLYY